jgi:hypothetical protein
MEIFMSAGLSVYQVPIRFVKDMSSEAKTDPYADTKKDYMYGAPDDTEITSYVVSADEAGPTKGILKNTRFKYLDHKVEETTLKISVSFSAYVPYTHDFEALWDETKSKLYILGGPISKDPNPGPVSRSIHAVVFVGMKRFKATIEIDLSPLSDKPSIPLYSNHAEHTRNYVSQSKTLSEDGQFLRMDFKGYQQYDKLITTIDMHLQKV